jgi:uncharacterized protein (UPF0333 family)
MKKLKEFKIVLLILLVVLVLVIVKSTGKNRFKQDAKSAIETITSNNFSVSLTDFSAAENQFLVVELNESGSVQFENSIKVNFEKLIDETILEKLKETENKILLVSEDNSLAIKSWVILNQLGFKNIFVLLVDENKEVVKYKFQPDTSARLESVSE